jgi:hypothetical protein
MVNLTKLTMRPVIIFCHWCSGITGVRTRACLAATALLNQDDPLKHVWILWKVIFGGFKRWHASSSCEEVARESRRWHKWTTESPFLRFHSDETTLQFINVSCETSPSFNLTKPALINKTTPGAHCDPGSTIGGELLLYSDN